MWEIKGHKLGSVSLDNDLEHGWEPFAVIDTKRTGTIVYVKRVNRPVSVSDWGLTDRARGSWDLVDREKILEPEVKDETEEKVKEPWNPDKASSSTKLWELEKDEELELERIKGEVQAGGKKLDYDPLAAGTDETGYEYKILDEVPNVDIPRPNEKQEEVIKKIKEKFGTITRHAMTPDTGDPLFKVSIVSAGEFVFHIREDGSYETYETGANTKAMGIG